MNTHVITENYEGNPKNFDKKLQKGDLDLTDAKFYRNQYTSNPIIAYLNINSLRNKIDSLREITFNFPVEILCIDETKLDDSFPDAQFKIEGYQFPPFRRDRNKNGGGKIVFIKDGLIAKRLNDFETKVSETISLELTISKKKWFIMFAYRPPNEENKHIFFNEISNTLNKALNLYDNILVTGDLNIDFCNDIKDTNNFLNDLIDTFSLSNLVKHKTCYKTLTGSLLDVMLTNKPKSFCKTCTIETGLSDCHKMIVTCLRAVFKKLPPKNINYRDYKNFDQDKFLHELDQEMIKGNFYNSDSPYNDFSKLFKTVSDKHAPLKQKKVRGNHAPFMTKELRKTIMDRSRLKNKYLKYPSRENFLNMRKMKNKCNSLCKKAKKNYIQKATEKGISSSKQFWNFVKPFLTNKGCISNDCISIKKGENFVDDEKELVEMFNTHYINIVEKTSGIPPENFFLDTADKTEIIEGIVKKYENHPSILEIKKNFDSSKKFEFPKAKVEDINTLLKQTNIKKATGPDTIPPKLTRLSANVIDSHLCNVINMDLDEFLFPNGAKIATVNPMYKKKSRDDIVNYRPVSILNAFSKIYERYILNSITPFVNEFLSVFISAYRKNYSSNHVLIRLIESWKQSLDNKNFVGAVLMDLSKAFDCIPHDLLIAKMYAYGFSIDSLKIFYSYLKDRKQNVKINCTYSVFQVLISGVPQGSILGPILFNIFVNDLLLWIKNAELHNFADDNTISCSEKTLDKLTQSLISESEKAVEWFKDNMMIVNPEKFQAIIIDRKNQDNNPVPLKISGKTIFSEKSVKLLGIEIDSKLNFDKHITQLCKKSASQLNAIIRLNSFLNLEQKTLLVNSFIYANFNYCPLVWHFCSKASMKKIEKIQYRALQFLQNDYESDYNTLLIKTQKCTMEVSRLRTMALEIFKSLNELNPPFMKNLFQQRNNTNRRKFDLNIPLRNSVTFGDKSLRCMGPHIWNALPENIKSQSSFDKFKESIKNWYGPSCKCSLCSNI